MASGPRCSQRAASNMPRAPLTPIFAKSAALLAWNATAAALLCGSPNLAFGADANSPAAATLPKVRVEGEELELGYATEQIRSATKTQAPIRDIPQSITVIPEALIEDQSMRSMADVVRYVPGVSMGQGEGHRDAPTLRGNSSTADFFIDGVRDDLQYFRDLYNSERIEVLKGPNAMIFGRGGGGGVINRVAKRADGEARRELELQAGTDDLKRISGDVGQSLTDAFAVRLNAMYEDSDSYRDFVEVERYGINPTASLTFSESTRLHFGYEYFSDYRTVDRGVPSLNGRPVDIDESKFFGNPNDSYSDVTVNLATATIEHEFTPAMTLRNHTLFGDYDKFYQNIYPASAVLPGDLVTLDAYNSGTRRENLFNQTDLIWRLTTGSVSHVMLAGIELGRQDTENRRNNSAAGAPGFVTLANTVTLTSPGALFTVPNQNNRADVSVAALYVQDELVFSDRFRLIAGVRFDQFEIEFDNHLTGTRFQRDDDLVSPRAGLVYKPAEPVSIYASYSVSYLPSSGDQFASLDATSAALEPEEFENVEVGIKWDARPDLALTAAAYQLDRTNTRAPGPTPGTVVLTGEQRSEGIELGLVGAVGGDWEIVAGYAYQDAEITQTTSAAPQGRAVPLVPEHQVSLWSTYRLSPMWRFGLGATFQADMFASITNAVELPSFTRVDAAAYFTLNERFEAQLNVENLLDEHYYGTAHNDNNITPGSPTAVRLALRARF
jgi:catecholate siderophore receptor